MEFNSRATPIQPQPVRSSTPGPMPEQHHINVQNAQPGNTRKPSPQDLLSMGSRISSAALLVILALLVGSLVWLISASSPTQQSKYIASSKLQAVFLNTGQVYFGNIRSVNKDYTVLSNAYYLQSSSAADSKTAAANQNVSLVKLGCELHKPYDTMIINTSQVTFWENLQSDGQVGKAVAQFVQQNPNGQKCSDTPAGSSTNLQNTGTAKP